MAVPSKNEETLSSTAKRPLYPRGIPIKFNADGEVQRYPGNTTVCHIPTNTLIHSRLRAAYDKFGAHPTLGPIFRRVPLESWHMTVVDGVRETECEPGMWEEGKEKKPLEESTREFSKSLRQLGLQLESEGLAPPYRMRVRGFGDMEVGAGLEVEGATPEEEKRMRRLRDRLADTLGFRAPNHEIYPFHITLGYWLRHVDGDNKAELHRFLESLLPVVKVEFELGAVEFCTFEDMCSFPRLFYLGDKEE